MATSDVLFDAAWHSYSCGDFHGLGKCVTSNGSLKLVVTDLKRVYSESLNSAGLEKRCKELNPGLEVTTPFLLKHLDLHTNSALRDNSSISLKVTDLSSEKLTLDLASNISGVPLVWEYCLAVQDADELYNLVTLPMVLMVAGLQQTQNELIKRLRSIDAQLKESAGERLSQQKRNFDECTFLNQVLESGILHSSVGNILKNTFNSDGEDLFKTFMKTYRNGLEDKEAAAPPAIETSETACTQPEVTSRKRDFETQSDSDPATQTQVCSVGFKAKKPKRNMRL